MTIFSITSDSEGGGLQPVYISNFTFFHFFLYPPPPRWLWRGVKQLMKVQLTNLVKIPSKCDIHIIIMQLSPWF